MPLRHPSLVQLADEMRALRDANLKLKGRAHELEESTKSLVISPEELERIRRENLELRLKAGKEINKDDDAILFAEYLLKLKEVLAMRARPYSGVPPPSLPHSGVPPPLQVLEMRARGEALPEVFESYTEALVQVVMPLPSLSSGAYAPPCTRCLCPLPLRSCSWATTS